MKKNEEKCSQHPKNFYVTKHLCSLWSFFLLVLCICLGKKVEVCALYVAVARVRKEDLLFGKVDECVDRESGKAKRGSEN